MYDIDIFREDLSELTEMTPEQIKQLIETLKKIPIDSGRSWIEFDAKMTSIVEDAGLKDLVKEQAELPDYLEATELKDMALCLMYLRNCHTELSLKSYLTGSLCQKKELYNYFARIYHIEWYKLRNRKDAWLAFLMLYAELKITDTMTTGMLNWMIHTHGTKVVGNSSESIDRSLLNILSTGQVNYETISHSTVLRIAYALRIVEEPSEESCEATRTRMIEMFRSEGYDWHSALDQIYFYGTVYNKTPDEIREALQSAAECTFKELLLNVVPEKKKKSITRFVQNYIQKSRQSADTLLRFSKHQGENGLLMQICAEAGVKTTWPELKERLRERLLQMDVPLDNVLEKSNDTMRVSDRTIKDYVLKEKNFLTFVQNICRSGELYVDFFKKHQSISRGSVLFGNPRSNEEMAAREIYWNNSFANLDFDDAGMLYKKQWKTEIKGIPDEEGRLEKIRELFESRLDEIDQNDFKKKRQEGWKNLRQFRGLDRTAFYNALLDEIKRDEAGIITRENYLYSTFTKAVTQSDPLGFFMEQVDDESFMADLGLYPFDELNYQDIYLYMCLGTYDPMDTFQMLESEYLQPFWRSDS